jgi:hypothetical protein
MSSAAEAILDALTWKLAQLERELAITVEARRTHFTNAVAWNPPNAMVINKAMLDDSLDQYAESSDHVMDLRIRIAELRRGIDAGAT